MGFLLGHWHCILPLAALAIGFFFVGWDKGKKEDGQRHSGNDPETP